MSEYEQTKTGPVPYTLEDLLNWPAEECWEILQGVGYAPVEALKNKSAVKKLSDHLTEKFAENHEEKNLTIISRPSGIAFHEEYESFEESSSVVKPDLAVLNNAQEIIENYFTGSPKFILAVSNAESALRDHMQRLALYETSQVAEYWILEQEQGILWQHLLNKEGKYELPTEYKFTDSISSPTLNTSINLSEFW